ncbi:metallophosphoesterase family protein [Actinospica durhamensis]|uniref:Metallophosphoesterase family protein n=1 Tax=Actinospica durhamensis TaxID=1508375 RepID=A0A941EN70_9ACTN|nr:metallophosphoesterase family protein [Actinospica durhamensis]MBR7832119.1 metallophosphoesterase family protein [Actinospica durhamensis]
MAEDLGTDTFGRIAVVSDVHGNVPALTAVLAQIESAEVDLVVSCGDLTWGAEPDRTVRLMAGLGARARFVSGNADRAVTELSAGLREVTRPRETWVMGLHSPASLEFVRGFPAGLVLQVAGLGAVRFCHGSPRADTELVTPGTSPERFAELSAGVPERVIVGGHTHVQFDHTVNGLRFVNPGSVGLPHHEGEPGTAYWAILGPDVELRRTSYDVTEAIEVGHRLGDPAAEVIERLLTTPPTPSEVEEDARRLTYSD